MLRYGLDVAPSSVFLLDPLFPVHPLQLLLPNDLIRIDREAAERCLVLLHDQVWRLALQEVQKGHETSELRTNTQERMPRL